MSAACFRKIHQQRAARLLTSQDLLRDDRVAWLAFVVLHLTGPGLGATLTNDLREWRRRRD